MGALRACRTTVHCAQREAATCAARAPATGADTCAARAQATAFSIQEHCLHLTALPLPPPSAAAAAAEPPADIHYESNTEERKEERK